MEDDLIFFSPIEDDLIFFQMEGDLIFLMEDDLIKTKLNMNTMY